MDAALHTAVNRHRMARFPVNEFKPQQTSVEKYPPDMSAEISALSDMVAKLRGRIDALEFHIGALTKYLAVPCEDVVIGSGLSIAKIKQTVCQEYKIPHAVLVGSTRAASIVRPRQIAIYLCKKLLPGLSLGRIARQFANRDHTTILHAFRSIEVKRSEDQYLDVEIKNFETRLMSQDEPSSLRGVG